VPGSIEARQVDTPRVGWETVRAGLMCDARVLLVIVAPWRLTLWVLAFRSAFARWADPACDQAFGELARAELEALQAASASLS